MRNGLLVFSLLLLCACQTIATPWETARVRRQITTLENRVSQVEAAVDSSTAALSGQNEDISVRVGYRPIVAWAESFSAGPATNRTVTFQQTGSSGYIIHQNHLCRLFGTKQDGYYAEIDGRNATRASLLINRFSVVPMDDGLQLTSALHLDARTQVKGQFRPRCVDTSIGTTVGVTGETRPTADFRFRVAGAADNAARYTIDLVSPNSIGVEMRFHLGGFGRVGYTFPMEGLAKQISSGEVGLLFDNEGDILLPDSQVVHYRIRTRNPTLRTSTAGLQFATGVDIDVQRDTAAVDPQPR